MGTPQSCARIPEMSTNSSESFLRRLEGSSRQQNTRESSSLKTKASPSFRWESSTMMDMTHMMSMMRMMDMMTKGTSQCPITCSSNHIDTAPGL